MVVNEHITYGWNVKDMKSFRKGLIWCHPVIEKDKLEL